VSVIVDVEGAVSEQAGRDISLTDDRAMSQAVSPFTDVNADRLHRAAAVGTGMNPGGSTMPASWR
jgi:hypothetical protein